MEIRSLFIRLIWIFLCVFRNRGQNIIGNNIRNISIGKVEYQEEFHLPKGIMFNVYRKPSQMSRIIGGGIANPHSYPFQVEIQVKITGDLSVCGGTLLSTEWVLTAAHCISKAEYALVVLGAHDIGVAEVMMKIMNSTTLIPHKKYDRDTLIHDIGVIKLPNKATLNEYIQTVRLMTTRKDLLGITARCLGWGKTILGTSSQVLRYVDLDVISNDVCKTYPEFTAYIQNTHLCTTGEGFVGSCQGDSGGPLIYGDEQIGIVSFGATRCEVGDPSVFTRISEYLDWINENTGMEFQMRSGGDSCTIEPFIKSCMGIMVFIFFVYLLCNDYFSYYAVQGRI